MRVVHLVPAMEQGGVESVVCDLNRALVRAGHESVVISRGGRLAARIEAEGGLHLALDLKSKNPLTYLPRMLRLRRALRGLAGPGTLVCAHSRVPAWLFVGANRALRLPWITYAHGANSRSRYSAVMTRGDLVVTPSRFLADYLKAGYGLDARKLRVIPNGIDLGRFDPERLDAAFVEEKRREWGLRADDFVTMAVGRITPLKGYEELIRTTPPDRRLVIVGGADADKVDYLAHLKAIAGPQVVFAGPQTKIPECLSLATEVVSANTRKPESFGLSVVEAYAMNRPVRLLRHFGGAAEVVDAVRAAGCATFREAVRKLYDFDIMARSTIAAYEEVVR